MNAKYKKFFIILKKIVILVFVLIATIVFWVQIFLGYGLTESVRKHALPLLSELTGRDMSIDKITVNLPRSLIALREVRVSNPAEFAADEMLFVQRAEIKVGLMTLLKGNIADIKRVRIKDGKLNLVRNNQGHINIQSVIDAAKQDSPSVSEESVSRSFMNLSESVSSFRIGSIDVDFKVHYIDYKIFEDPLDFGVDLDLRLRNISNHGAPEILSGAITAQGIITGEENHGVVNLRCMIGPIADPMRVSFVASGRVEDFSLKNLRLLAEKRGLKYGHISGSLNLKCDSGVFDHDQSELKLVFHDTSFTEEMDAKMRLAKHLKSFSIAIPIGGTIEQPHIDIQSAIQRSLLSDEVISSVLRGLAKQDEGLDGVFGGIEMPPHENEKRPGKSKSFDLREVLKDLRRGP